MKHVSKYLLGVATFYITTVSAIATTFINGGFEDADLNGWTLHSGTWNSTSQTQNDSHQGDSAIISTPATTDANTLGHLYGVLQGNDSLRLNDSANGAHFSTLTQTVVGYTDPAMYFGFAAVLENPDSGHTGAQTPQFSFSIFDVSLGRSLYSVAFDSLNAASMGVTWNTGLRNGGNSSTWMYTDWNVIHVDTSVLSGYNGHTFTVSVAAYDCALGGHGGYAYVDSFQNSLPVANHGTFNLLQADQLGSVPEPGALWMCLMGMLSVCWRYGRSAFSKLSCQK